MDDREVRDEEGVNCRSVGWDGCCEYMKYDDRGRLLDDEGAA